LIFQPEAQQLPGTVSNQTLGIWLAVLSLFAAIATPILGFVIRTTREYITGVSESAKERHSDAMREIAASEARCMAQVKDTEARAEKGDEKILAHVNSQYAEINANLRDIRESLRPGVH
jgi:Na+-translocating ferredoxin:NAD+ oxidoreductase RnfG subunit